MKFLLGILTLMTLSGMVQNSYAQNRFTEAAHRAAQMTNKQIESGNTNQKRFHYSAKRASGNLEEGSFDWKVFEFIKTNGEWVENDQWRIFSCFVAEFPADKTPASKFDEINKEDILNGCLTKLKL